MTSVVIIMMTSVVEIFIVMIFCISIQSKYLSTYLKEDANHAKARFIFQSITKVFKEIFVPMNQMKLKGKRRKIHTLE